MKKVIICSSHDYEPNKNPRRPWIPFIVSVARLVFWGRVCSAVVTVGHCGRVRVVRSLLGVGYKSFLAPCLFRIAVLSHLSLPLADESRVFLSDPTLRHSQNPQADDGGRLFGKLLGLLPENSEMIYHRFRPMLVLCVTVCVLTTLKICISSLLRSRRTERLDPESAAPEKHNKPKSLLLFCIFQTAQGGWIAEIVFSQ